MSDGKLVVFRDGVMPVGGVSPGALAEVNAKADAALLGLAEEIEAREAAENLGDTIRLSNVAGANAVTAEVPAGQSEITIGNGTLLLLTPVVANTGEVTLTVGSVTYNVLTQDGAALIDGDLQPNQPVLLRRMNATVMRIIGAAARDVRGLRAAVGLILTTVDNTSGAGARALNTYTSAGARVVFNPNGEGGVISNLPVGAVAPPNNAILTVRPYGTGVLQEYQDAVGRWTRYWNGAMFGTFEAALGMVIPITAASSAGDRTANSWKTPYTHIEITSATISNAPGGTEAITSARCDVSRSGALLVQIWVYADGRKYRRSSADNGTTWDAWALDNGVSVATVNISALSAGSRNFNSHYSEWTVYVCDGSAAITNGPFGTASYFGIMFVTREGENLVQNFYLPEQDTPHRRVRRAGSFDPHWSRNIPALAQEYVGWIGDSITHGVGSTDAALLGFVAIAAQHLGCGFVKWGTAGAQMSPTTAANADHQAGSFNRKVAAEVAAIANLHVLVVAYGTNDFNRATVIGSLSDATEGTFYGAMNLGYEDILEANADCRVVFILPTFRSVSNVNPAENLAANSAGHTLQAYRDAIVAFCQARNLEYVDAYSRLGINPLNVFSLTTDGLHPNNAGHAKMGALVARALK